MLFPLRTPDMIPLATSDLNSSRSLPFIPPMDLPNTTDSMSIAAFSYVPFNSSSSPPTEIAPRSSSSVALLAKPSSANLSACSPKPSLANIPLRPPDLATSAPIILSLSRSNLSFVEKYVLWESLSLLNLSFSASACARDILLANT